MDDKDPGDGAFHGEARDEADAERPTSEEILAEPRKDRGLIPAGYRFDREDANRRR